jgi:membrane protein
VLKGFGVHNQVEPLLLNVLESMGPEMAREISDLVINFVDNAQVGLLGGVGLLFLFYTVLTLMQRIEGAFNYSWHVDRGRNVAHMVSTYLTTILLGPALVFASLTMTATLASTELMASLQQTPVLGFLLEWGGRLIPYITIVIAFALLYLFIPNTHVRFKSALVGAAVAGVLWQISGVLFTEFFANSDRYALYAAFATLFVFMFWLYISWLILLLGASIAFYHQNPHFTSAGHAELRMNMRARETIAIAVLREIADRFYKGGAPWTAGGLAEKLGTPDTAVDWTVRVLTEGKLITESGENDECLLPARAPESMLLSDVIELIRNADDTGCASKLPPPHDDQAGKLLVELAETRRAALEGRTVKSLLDDAKNS